MNERIAAILFLGLAPLRAVGAQSTAAPRTISCSDLERQINNSDVLDVPFGAIEHLNGIVRTLESRNDCDPYLKLRAYWARARALDAYASSRAPIDASSARQWREQAAMAYRALLDWISVLERPSIERLVIGTFGVASVDSSQFQRLRLRLVQDRPAKSLFGLVNSMIAIRDFTGLFDDLERYAKDLPDAFSNNTIRDWVYWLRTQADFKFKREDPQVRQVLSVCDECKARWSTFVQFVRSNGSAQQQWQHLARRVEPWLD